MKRKTQRKGVEVLKEGKRWAAVNQQGGRAINRGGDVESQEKK